MLRKIGQVSVGVVCLMAVSSFAYAAGDTATGQDAPTIAELAAFGEAPAGQAVAAEPTAPVVTPDADTAAVPAADDLLDKFRTMRIVEEQKRKAEAADLAAQAHHAIYISNAPAEARKLAEQALLLDPENAQAKELLLEARVQMGEEAALQQAQQDGLVSGVPVRVQSLLQSLRNSIVRARELYAHEQYEDALVELRKARLAVDVLATSADVSQQRDEVERLLATVEKDHEESQRRLAGLAAQQAADAADENIRRIVEVQRAEQARRAQEVMDLIKHARFEDAELLLDDMEAVDPSDATVLQLRGILSDAEFDHTSVRLAKKLEWGDLKFENAVTMQEIVPSRTFNYPDKGFWQNVVELRRPPTYPSDRPSLGHTEADKPVFDALDMHVSFPFNETPLVDVVEFLRQVTPVSYSLRRQEIPADGAPVTLTIDTTLKNGLNLITDLTGMAWKVESGLIKIGSPESIRDYDMRIYNVGDLLLSYEDRGGDDDSGWGGSSSSGSSSRSSSSRGYNPQYRSGSSSSSSDDDDEEGFSSMTSRVQNLVLLMKMACGEGTWEDTSGGLIDMDDDDESGSSGFEGGAFGSSRTGFAAGAQPADPYAIGGPGFGGPGGFAPGGAMGMPVQQAPRGRAVVMAHDPQSIMVHQTPEVHECIETLLKELRAAMKVQIKVDVRFLSVGNDFLREVGFNWSHFSLDPDGYDASGNIDGFNMASPSYGGFVPWVQPGGVLGFDGEGEVIGIIDSLPFGFGHPFGDADAEFDEDTMSFSFTKAPLTGTSFIQTGIPFFGAQTGGLALDFGYSGAVDIGGTFRLGHKRDQVKMLSAPTITLANGQRGFISVSTDYSYIATYSVDGNILIPEIEEVGDTVELRVRPIASADLKYVFMELEPVITVTDLTRTAPFTTFVGVPGGEGGGAGAAVQNFMTLPTVNEQTLETTVGVPDRGVLIVGGLTAGERTRHEGGVPILDKIPVVKRLFSAEGRRVSRDQLFVMACPEIIELGEQEQRVSSK